MLTLSLFRFHAIYWPAFLMAANLPLPKQILAHAHWTMNKQKMSKSKGNVVDPFELIDFYGADAVRYFLVRDGGLADDGGEYILKCIYQCTNTGLLCRFLREQHDQTIQGSGWSAWKPIVEKHRFRIESRCYGTCCTTRTS